MPSPGQFGRWLVTLNRWNLARGSAGFSYMRADSVRICRNFLASKRPVPHIVRRRKSCETGCEDRVVARASVHPSGSREGARSGDRSGWNSRACHSHRRYLGNREYLRKQRVGRQQGVVDRYRPCSACHWADPLVAHGAPLAVGFAVNCERCAGRKGQAAPFFLSAPASRASGERRMIWTSMIGRLNFGSPIA